MAATNIALWCAAFTDSAYNFLKYQIIRKYIQVEHNYNLSFSLVIYRNNKSIVIILTNILERVPNIYILVLVFCDTR